MKHEPQDWSIDVNAKQAIHVSGFVLRAERVGNAWNVRPLSASLPPHNPPMPSAAVEAATTWIEHLVTQGGQQLVHAITKHLSMN